MSVWTIIGYLVGVWIAFSILYTVYYILKRIFFPSKFKYKRPPINDDLVGAYKVLEDAVLDSGNKEYQTSLVGIHYENRMEVLKSLDDNEKVILFHDEGNEHDPFAIKCITLRGEELGYLKRGIGGMTSLGEKLAGEEVVLPVTQFRFNGEKAMLKFCVVED